MRPYWRVIYEDATIAWIRRQRPNLLQIIAVLEWAKERRSLGLPDDIQLIPDPDEEDFPEDRLTSIALANVDIVFGFNDVVSDGPVLWVRRIVSY